MINKIQALVKGLVIAGISLCAASGATGCKMDGEDIGDLYGRWRLRSIRNDAGLIYEPDIVYLSFMAEVYMYQPNWEYDWGTFERQNDSITLNPLNYESAFGFRDLMHNNDYNGRQPVSFKVVTLTDDELIWRRSDTVWHFRKYLE